MINEGWEVIVNIVIIVKIKITDYTKHDVPIPVTEYGMAQRPRYSVV